MKVSVHIMVSDEHSVYFAYENIQAPALWWSINAQEISFIYKSQFYVTYLYHDILLKGFKQLFFCPSHKLVQ